MKQYRVYIWDGEIMGTRIYLVSAKDKQDIISKFSNIFRNNPKYSYSSSMELIVDELPRFEYFRQY